MDEIEKILVTRKNIRSIILKMDRHGKFHVSAPWFVTKKQIKKFLKERESWIKEKSSKFLNNKNRHNPITDGYYYFLGEKIFSENNTKESLREVYKRKSPDIIEPLLLIWSKKTGLDYNDVSYKIMRSRWGSCNHSKKYLNFNTILVGSPTEAVEYVILHELAHLVFPHHGRDFWNFVESFMPDWKEKRKKLIFFEV
ncbi:MAG: M48 family metallopeptidase [Fusobacteriaceae bacterium]